MSPIHFQATYHLSDQYDSIKSRAHEFLCAFYSDDSIYHFNDEKKTLTFTSERLIPAVTCGRKRVLLLFSNPHPHSIQQGMFLLPSVIRKRKLFLDGNEGCRLVQYAGGASISNPIGGDIFNA